MSELPRAAKVDQFLYVGPKRVPAKRLKPEQAIPDKQTPGAACVDLRAANPVVVPPNGTALVNAGIAVAIPEGFVGLVCSRSGLALKKSVFVLNAPGIIDSDYRGEVGVILHNLNPAFPFHVEAGDRVAQLMVIESRAWGFVEVSQLDETERGEGGFGSTGEK